MKNTLTKEDEVILMGYLGITKKDTAEKYKSAINQFINDPTQVIEPSRLLALQNKVASL